MDKETGAAPGSRRRRDAGQIPDETREQIMQIAVKLSDQITRAKITLSTSMALDILQRTQEKLPPQIRQLLQDTSLIALKPYIDAELAKPEYNGATFEEVYEAGIDDETSTVIPGSIYEKVLLAALSELEPLDDNILQNDFLPSLNTAPISLLMRLGKRDFVPDPRPKASCRKQRIYSARGVTITIQNFEKLQGGLSVAAKKILNTGILYLTRRYHHPTGTQYEVHIPLTEYAEACGYRVAPEAADTIEDREHEEKRIRNMLVDLAKAVKKDLADIAKIKISVDRDDGGGEYSILSEFDASARQNVIYMNFSKTIAEKLLENRVLIQFPLALLRIDNRNPNAYSIGYKIAMHGSMDNNYKRGTDRTLSVKTLLCSAPQIATAEELQMRGQRNWKSKIKSPLEKSLDTLISVGVLKKWEYRHPDTQSVYTAATAGRLSYDKWSDLMVDWIPADNPDQDKRRERKAAERKQDKSGTRKEKK